MKESNDYKIKFVDSEYEKCKRIIKKSLNSNNYEKAMAAISVAGLLMYQWNQTYTDTFLEKSILMVAKKTIKDSARKLDTQSDVILFYDAFGYDTRGLALIYLKALISTKCKIIYVVPKSSKNHQPEIDKLLERTNVEKVYYSSKGYYGKVGELQKIICLYKPAKMFMYTMPYDSAGVVVFTQFRNIKRYQINLTDHAFWLGINAFDYCLEFREYGASISHYRRGIKRDKLILLPYYPIIDKDAKYQGLPFDPSGKKIIFSGGSLYKTIDETGTFYSIVSEILNMNKDVVFLYAGQGNSKYIDSLSKKYNEQVYHINERKDLYQLMKHITLYLNTYPVAGGLMMQYAAIAEKIPITLSRGVENSGILIGQEKRRIEYKNTTELIDDVYKLLNDSEYMKKREQLMKGSVITETEFEEELKNVICNSTTKYKIKFFEVESGFFLKDYIERFDINDYETSIASINNLSLFFEYVKLYYKKVIKVVMKKRGR